MINNYFEFEKCIEKIFKESGFNKVEIENKTLQYEIDFIFEKEEIIFKIYILI